MSCASVEGRNLGCNPFSSFVGASLTSYHHSTCANGPDWTEAKCLRQSPNWEFHVWLRLWLHLLRLCAVYSGTQMCAHEPIWRPEDNLSCRSSTAICLAFWDIIFHWLGDHQVGYTGSLVNAKDLPVFASPVLGLHTHCNPMTGFFYVGSADLIQNFMLTQQAIYPESSPQPHNLYLFIWCILFIQGTTALLLSLFQTPLWGLTT